MRLTRHSSSRLGPRRPAANTSQVRWPVLLCLVGLLVAFGGPALALGQSDEGGQRGAEQGQRGTPVVLATATASVAPADAAATPPAATPVAAPALQGVFSVGIGEADLPPGLAGAPALVGLWNLSLAADGTYALARQDVGSVAAGSYSVTGETLTFKNWSGVLACTDLNDDGEEQATYAWRLSEDTLTLTPIADDCADRVILFATRNLGSFEACATQPLALPEAPAAGPGISPPGVLPVGPESVGTPGATPVLGADLERGVPAGADVEEAIDSLLRQATGCWATGDPTLFLPLHSQQVLFEFIAFPSLISDLQIFMAQPVGFERVGGGHLLAPDRAWAYVEVTFGGEQPFAIRFDFVQQRGGWLMDTFFLFPPADSTAPQPLP